MMEEYEEAGMPDWSSYQFLQVGKAMGVQVSGRAFLRSSVWDGFNLRCLIKLLGGNVEEM